MSEIVRNKNPLLPDTAEGLPSSKAEGHATAEQNPKSLQSSVVALLCNPR